MPVVPAFCELSDWMSLRVFFVGWVGQLPRAADFASGVRAGSFIAADI